MTPASPLPKVSCRILIVEDEAVLALGLRETLEDLGHTVVGTTATGEEALRLARELAPELVFVDIRLAGALDGIATAEQLRAIQHVPVVYLTAYADEETVRRAKITEPFGYLHKPCQARDLRTAIELALYKHQAERKLKASEERYAATIRSAFDGIITVDACGNILLLNPAAVRLTGWPEEEARGQDILTVLPLLAQATGVPIAHPVQEVLANGLPVATTAALLRQRAGTTLPIEATTAPLATNTEVNRNQEDSPGVGAVITFRDISERKRTEELLRYTQKLESLGVLAGGVAHDFNNLLTPILGYTALVAENLPPDSPLVLMLRHTEQAARQAAELTQQLLAYAGQRTVNPQPVNLATLVTGMEAILTAGRPTKIRFELNLAPDLPAIEGEPVQLRQVILNLVVNAYEAVDETSGTIRVSATVIDLDAATHQHGGESILYPGAAGNGPGTHTFAPDTVPSGRYVGLEVTDNGRGITPEILPRLFDPFFSTKLAGRGLGLAATLGIVRSHKGTIRVHSQPGRGSTFQVLLPTTDRSATTPGAAETTSPAVQLHGTVLVIADDVSLRVLFQRLLELQGLTVLLAEHTASLDQILTASGSGSPHAPALDAIVFDLGGFGNAARDILGILHSRVPEIPVVLSVGLDPGEVVACCAGQTPAAILQKPFRPAQLMALLARLIQRNLR
jgi:PAS domain S-box-containing protein